MAVFVNSGGVLEENFFSSGSNTWSGPFQLAANVTGPVAALGDPDGGTRAVFFTDGASGQII
jgi:hypothetical protein